ncbi:ABC transporter ATP-binding protein [Nocardiopsis gilva]
MSALGGYVLERTAHTLVLHIRRELVARLLRLRMSEVDRLKPGDLISRVTSDTNLLRNVVTNSITQLVSGVVLLVLGLAIMFYLDAVLFGITVAVAIVVVLILTRIIPHLAKSAFATQSAVGEMGARLERVFGAYRTFKSFSAEHSEMAQLGTVADRAWRKGVAVAGWQAGTGTLGWISVNLAFLIVLAVGASRVSSNALEISSLIAYLLLIFYLMQPVFSTLSGITVLQTGLAALRRIEETALLETETELDVADHRTCGAAPAPATVVFDRVNFAYDADSTNVLTNVSFSVDGPGLTAIVGPSGTGKTTLLSLIERFYDAADGSLAIDGKDVTEWPLRELRSNIGYVEQDSPVFDGSLRENLTISAPDATEEEISRAVELARLTDLTSTLPGGLDGEIGHRGATVSGGERQRIAIARALLRKPRVLLLDEVTSQLDAANEAALKRTITEIAEHATVIVVAHRLSTVSQADRIIVMESGRVRVTGRHDELMDSDDLYQDLVRSQVLT